MNVLSTRSTEVEDEGEVEAEMEDMDFKMIFLAVFLWLISPSTSILDPYSKLHHSPW